MSWWSKYSLSQMEEMMDFLFQQSQGGGSSASLIHQASRTIDDDDIANSPLTPVSLCGGSSDLILLPYFAAIRVVGGQDFGAIDANARIVIGNTVGVELSAPIAEAVNNAVTAVLTSGNGSDSLVYVGPRLLDPGSPGDPTSVVSPLGSFVGGSSRGAGLVLLAVNGGLAFSGGTGTTFYLSVAFYAFDATLNKFLNTDESGYDEETRTFS